MFQEVDNSKIAFNSKLLRTIWYEHEYLYHEYMKPVLPQLKLLPEVLECQCGLNWKFFGNHEFLEVLLGLLQILAWYLFIFLNTVICLGKTSIFQYLLKIQSCIEINVSRLRMRIRDKNDGELNI